MCIYKQQLCPRKIEISNNYVYVKLKLLVYDALQKRSSQTVSAVLRGNVLSYKTNGPKKDFFLLNVMYALNLCF